MANAGRENLNATHASKYDTKQDASAVDEVALLETLGLGATSVVVDMGAGTGQFAMAVAPRCRKVVAVDVSPVMLAPLRSKLAGSALGNVDIVEAGFLTYEHAGPPADFVYSRWALHHLPDFWKAVALARVRRFTATGGVVRLCDVVFNFPADQAEARLEAWCASLGDAAEDAWGRGDLEEHVRDEHSTFTWLLEAMIERAGFRIERANYSADGIFADYVARAT